MALNGSLKILCYIIHSYSLKISKNINMSNFYERGIKGVEDFREDFFLITSQSAHSFQP